MPQTGVPAHHNEALRNFLHLDRPTLIQHTSRRIPALIFHDLMFALNSLQRSDGARLPINASLFQTKEIPMSRMLSLTLGRIGLLMVTAILVAAPASAQEFAFNALHEFVGSDGAFPFGNLISDSAGNMYGVAGGGGIQNSAGCSGGQFIETTYCGAAFQLTKTASGYTFHILHQFTGASDGGSPLAGLTLDSAGNLYGTTAFGGSCPYAPGCGVVYELSPTKSGPWTETVLYSFQGGDDGGTPESQMVFDSEGNLYGTAHGGGSGSCGFGVPCGVVFELSPAESGPWTETVIYNFSSFSDGIEPQGPLVRDAHGNLFGTTPLGGSVGNNCGYPYYGCGTVFEISPSAGGWTKTTLYTFQGVADGAQPQAGVILDSAGHLYGTADQGGNANGCVYNQDPGCGVVFTLRPSSSGEWTEQVIATFEPDANGNPGTTGGSPAGSLVFDSAGNIYGTASQGGAGNGVVFKLSKSSPTKWNETELYSFNGLSEGAGPVSNIVVGPTGNLFGTTIAGGKTSDQYCSGTCGLVFALKP
jgi:uncharacterized repeat protein (TIGR03803 family)